MAAERLGDLARHRTELPQRVILQDQRDAKGSKDRRQRVAAEQRAQCGQVNRRAEQRDDESGGDECDPKIAGSGQGNNANIGAQHEQLAMGKVDYVHDAEDQRQARGHQGEDHAGDDAVDRLDQDLLDRNPHLTRSPG
jgi:hypothetical protein